MAVGQVIVATWQPHEAEALELIKEMGLELQMIFNKGAVMVLPSGVNKAVRPAGRARRDGAVPTQRRGVGDAENDHAFLSVCECAVAVANALPALKERADVLPPAPTAQGVNELIEQMLRDDLAASSRAPAPSRHRAGQPRSTAAGERSRPTRAPVLFAGSSGGGKSTVATALIEALTARGYQTCIIDPEGDLRDIPLDHRPG